MDAHEINQTADLLALVERDTGLRRAGAYYIGPCPFCGGSDRFTLKPTPNGWKWYCRGCGDGKYHGAIDYVMQRDNLSFRDALNALGGTALPVRPRDNLCQPVIKPFVQVARPDAMQASWGEAVTTCAAALWQPGGELARDYLHRRGLTDDTLRAYQVGVSNGREVAGCWVAAGVVLPWIADGYISKIRIRRFEDGKAAASDKYRMVKTHGTDTTGLFGADTCRAAHSVFLVEGEFDAMLLAQQAQDRGLGVATLGSASAAPSDTFWGLFGLALVGRRLLIAYDADRAGADGAQAWAAFPRARFVEIPRLSEAAKDITDYHLDGGNLRLWALASW